MFDPHVFTLPPGVDFATELVAGLRERMAGPPESMATVRLFLNSERMRRRVIAGFTAQGAGFLPRIAVIKDLAQDPILADLPQGTSALRRQLDLARLIGKLLEAQPDLAPRAALYDLADSLARLLAEMQDEGVGAGVIAGLDVSNHSAHWARTQAFLAIIEPFSGDASDPEARQRTAVLRLTTAWKAVPPEGPVIVAGSTGSRGVTALLMQAVARLRHGAVVLPGFDGDLPDAVWRTMEDALTAEDHPQYRFRKLMAALDLSPENLRPWRDVVAPDPTRNRLISLSLRPAPVTDQWLVEGAALPDLLQVTARLTLIEALSPRDEALAIALVLRHAVDQGVRAALITPDRGLTRRVAAALDIWGIRPDDSAGSPLALSAPGRLLRHVAAAFVQPLTADTLLIVLKHPLTGSGADRGNHLRFTRELELELRRKGPAFPRGRDVVAWAQRRDQADCTIWAQALARVLEAFEAPPPPDLTGQVARHIAVTEGLAQGSETSGAGQLWAGAAGEAALALMQQLRLEAPFGDDLAPATYCDLFEQQVNKGEVREPFNGHPLVAFYGAREAREMRADLVILGGLTDGIWPASGDPDPWLNRKMRKDAGLLLPERQIGLAAHDYQQAVAAQRVILSRSTRDAEAETVPSRWLNRLCNLMAGLPERNGPAALDAMRARGHKWLAQAAALDRPTAAQRGDARLQPAPRPAPQPPVKARPDRLSLTRIATLIRDPYAIYARYILQLQPLDPLRAAVDTRDRGIALHEILRQFVQQRPPGETKVAAKQRLLEIATQVLADLTPFPSARLLWRARLERAADHFLRQDSKHGGVALLVEEKGSISLTEPIFTLFGTPDRIDRLADGRLHLIDYKSGAPPTAAQQKAYDKQLWLAAALAERGGFAALGRAEVARISYIGLGSGEKVVETDVTTADLDAFWARFCKLIAAYARRDTGYAARRAVFDVKYAGDYDHLARFGEWQLSDRATKLRVGPGE